MIGIYHSRDLDGWCSGAIIKKKYPEATLIGFDYGNSFEDLLAKISPDDEVIMADVSLPMEQMAQLADHVFGKFTWIDHHASAIADYTEYMLKNFHGSTTGFLTSVLHDGNRGGHIKIPEAAKHLRSVWDGWFILGLYKEAGRQITYHLPLSRWTECEFAEVLQKAPDWDGHTSEEVLRRIKLL